MLESFLIGSLEDLDEDPSQPHTPARQVTSLLLENFLRIYGLLDNPDMIMKLPRASGCSSGCRPSSTSRANIWHNVFELIQQLDPRRPKRDLAWMGSWSPGAPT